MNQFIQKYGENTTGTLSGWDRVVLRGSLRMLCFADGMMGYLYRAGVLLKNFGVTRHGRVVFYDYDEICPLVDCNFRRLPQAQTDEQEMASQPWYDVADNDVFPEEFRLFFSGNRAAKEVFDKLHSDLYDAQFWTDLQQRISDGMVGDVFPYRRKYRFERPE